ncbi:hypothetical protein GQX74_010278 [Glossina fuscipes]|nr:hypothetical protein GQX74_010278 [Glossina fuscipes]
MFLAPAIVNLGIRESRDDTDREGVCSSKVLVLVEWNKISQGMLLCIERSSGVEFSVIVGLAGGVHCCCDESAEESDLAVDHSQRFNIKQLKDLKTKTKNLHNFVRINFEASILFIMCYKRNDEASKPYISIVDPQTRGVKKAFK